MRSIYCIVNLLNMRCLILRIGLDCVRIFQCFTCRFGLSKEQQAETRRQVEEIEGDAYHHHHDAGDENELFAQDQVRITPTPIPSPTPAPTSDSVHVLVVRTERFDKIKSLLSIFIW